MPSLLLQWMTCSCFYLSLSLYFCNRSHSFLHIPGHCPIFLHSLSWIIKMLFSNVFFSTAHWYAHCLCFHSSLSVLNLFQLDWFLYYCTQFVHIKVTMNLHVTWLISHTTQWIPLIFLKLPLHWASKKQHSPGFPPTSTGCFFLDAFVVFPPLFVTLNIGGLLSPDVRSHLHSVYAHSFGDIIQSHDSKGQSM